LAFTGLLAPIFYPCDPFPFGFPYLSHIKVMLSLSVVELQRVVDEAITM
jgi:hypothetical protein